MDSEIEAYLDKEEIKSEDPDNLDVLFELTDLLDKIFQQMDFQALEKLSIGIISVQNRSAFEWLINIIEEKFSNLNEKRNISLRLGKQINGYDTFIEMIGIEKDTEPIEIEIISIPGLHIESFFNINAYKTKFNDMFLVTAENFDSFDVDFIQYRLVFTEDIKKYYDGLQAIEKDKKIVDVDSKNDKDR